MISLLSVIEIGIVVVLHIALTTHIVVKLNNNCLLETKIQRVLFYSLAEIQITEDEKLDSATVGHALW